MNHCVANVSNKNNFLVDQETNQALYQPEQAFQQSNLQVDPQVDPLDPLVDPLHLPTLKKNLT